MALVWLRGHLSGVRDIWIWPGSIKWVSGSVYIVPSEVLPTTRNTISTFFSDING